MEHKEKQGISVSAVLGKDTDIQEFIAFMVSEKQDLVLILLSFLLSKSFCHLNLPPHSKAIFLTDTSKGTTPDLHGIQLQSRVLRINARGDGILRDLHDINHES